MPCETQGDEFCEVEYPPAEPTDPEVWRVWSRYWMVQAMGWEMTRDLVDLTMTERNVEWWLWAFGQIHGAVQERRAIETKEATRST